jgi:AcrR family transcriptional regulator
MTTEELGLRERSRRQTWAAIRAAALDEVREHGAVALSLRRVARRVGMSPAGLYRYVDSRDALLTALIAGAFDDLADHLLAATASLSDADVADRLRAVVFAYRHWAVTHPNEFGLLFGNPIPGYAAPPGGPTVDAMTRVGLALGGPLVEAWHAGRLEPRLPPLPDELVDVLTPMAKVAGEDAPPELGVVLLTAWGRLHGQVSLEVFGHHDWLFPDGCEALYRVEVESLLADLGVQGTPP